LLIVQAKSAAVRVRGSEVQLEEHQADQNVHTAS